MYLTFPIRLVLTESEAVPCSLQVYASDKYSDSSIALNMIANQSSDFPLWNYKCLYLNAIQTSSPILLIYTTVYSYYKRLSTALI